MPDFTPADGDADPPSPNKLALIRRFLGASGLQAALDSGAVLKTFGFAEHTLRKALSDSPTPVTVEDLFAAPVNALREAYLPHKGEFQEAYEAHVNWDYTEEQLAEVAAFLETATGQHFIVVSRRMEAYLGSELEDIIEAIVAVAESKLLSK